MRKIVTVGLCVAATALMAGCGKKEEPIMPEANSAAAPALSAAPAGPSPEQLKMLAALPAPYNKGDLANGEAKFAQCRSCHTITKGGPDLTGPNLWNIYGSKAAAVPGFSFSDAMKGSGIVWDSPAKLDQWIADPRTVLSDTKMTFLGVKDPTDRRDIVAYVAVQRYK